MGRWLTPFSYPNLLFPLRQTTDTTSPRPEIIPHLSHFVGRSPACPCTLLLHLLHPTVFRRPNVSWFSPTPSCSTKTNFKFGVTFITIDHHLVCSIFFTFFNSIKWIQLIKNIVKYKLYLFTTILSPRSPKQHFLSLKFFLIGFCVEYLHVTLSFDPIFSYLFIKFRFVFNWKT